MTARATQALTGVAVALMLAAACGDSHEDGNVGSMGNAATQGGGAAGEAGEPAAGQSGGAAGGAGEPMYNDQGFVIIPCPEDIEFSIGMEATGEQGLVKASLYDAEPAPPRRYSNDWVLDFVDAQGNPLEDMEIAASRAWMPAHGHDGTFPTQVEEMPEPGRFRVNSLNLWMGGHWEIQLCVNAGEVTDEEGFGFCDGEDYLVFDVCIPE